MAAWIPVARRPAALAATVMALLPLPVLAAPGHGGSPMPRSATAAAAVALGISGTTVTLTGGQATVDTTTINTLAVVPTAIPTATVTSPAPITTSAPGAPTSPVPVTGPATGAPTAPAPVTGSATGAPTAPAAAAPAPAVASVAPIAAPPTAVFVPSLPVAVLQAPVRPGHPEGLGLPAAIDVNLPPGAAGTRLAVALLALPLLLAGWLWAVVRVAGVARKRRAAARLALLAAQVGVSAESLAAIPSEERDALVGNLATDPVTHLPVRAPGTALLEREVAIAGRQRTPLAIAFIDLDGLKAANDSGGHEAGDRLLAAVATILQARLRASDIVYRHAGDEFIAVFPNTAAGDARDVMAELRRQATAAGAPFSYGVAMLEPGEAAAELVARADALQYADKRSRKASRDQTA